MSQNPARRTGRALAAARANQLAGAFDVGLRLVSAAEAGKPSDLERADAQPLLYLSLPAVAIALPAALVALLTWLGGAR